MEKASKPLNFGIVKDECVELIGRNPRKFENKQGVEFEPDILPSLSPAKGLAVCFWIYVETQVSGWNVVFHCGLDPHKTPSTWFHSDSTRLHARVSTTRNTNEGSDSMYSVFNIKTWHHAAYVLDENQLAYYVDGRLVISHLVDGEPVYPKSSQPFFIGHDTKYTSFNGQLKSFRYYAFALSKSQVRDDMESGEPVGTSDVRVSKVLSTYETLINNPTHSDVTFLVDGAKIFGHRCILSASSSYFRQLLGGSKHMKEASMSEINITGVAADTFLALLRYLYVGETPSDPQEAIKLMIAADYFSVERKLYNQCKDTLVGKLSVANACQLLRVADRFVYNESPMELILTFMSKNYATLVSDNELYTLPQSLLQKFLMFHRPQ